MKTEIEKSSPTATGERARERDAFIFSEYGGKVAFYIENVKHWQEQEKAETCPVSVNPNVGYECVADSDKGECTRY